jgi:superfamily I DNA/RNA helicase
VDEAAALCDAMRRAPGSATAANHFDWLRELIGDRLGWRPEDPVAEAVAGALETLARELPAQQRLDHEEFVGTVRDVLAEAGREPLGGAGGGVQVLGAMEARGATFAHLLVLGVNRDVFPRVAREDPLLPDRVRRALRVVLPDLLLKAASIDEERYLFAQLCSAGQRVTVSWQRSDDDGKPRPPSPLVERLRLARGAQAAQATDRPPIARVPPLRPAHEHAVLVGVGGRRRDFARVLELALAPRADAAALAAARVAALDEIDPDLRSPEGRTRARMPGAYQGLVGSLRDEGEARSGLHITRLEGVASCGWRVFLERLLGIEPTPDPAAELPAITPLLLGDLVHAALRADRPRGGSDRPRELAGALAAPPVAVAWPAPERLDEMLSAERHGSSATRASACPGSTCSPCCAAVPRGWWSASVDRRCGRRRGARRRGARRADLRDGEEGWRVGFRADRVDREPSGSSGPPDRLQDREAAVRLQAGRETRRAHLLDDIATGRRLQAVAYALGSPGPRGRYLFLGPAEREGDRAGRHGRCRRRDRGLLRERRRRSPRRLAHRRLRAAGARSPRRHPAPVPVLRGSPGLPGRRQRGPASPGGVARLAGRLRGPGARRGPPAVVARLARRGGGGVSGPARAALLRADQEARRAAQREFERPLVLEAGAGTGKTAILVARLLAWSLGPGWERGAEELGGRFEREGRRGEPGDELVAAAALDRVVAITFTDAAAAEMAERVADSLSAVIGGELLPWLDEEALPAFDVRVERARALLVALDHLVVCTIHAFCRRLLARYPLEAGLHPDFTVDAEGVALDQAVHEVVQEHLRRAFGASSDPQALALAAMGISPGGIAEALKLLVARGVAPEALEHEPYGPEAVAAMRRRLAGAIAELRAAGWTELASARNQKVASEVLDALAETERRLEQAEAGGAAALEAWCAALRQSWPKDLRGRLREWGRGKLNRGEAAVLGERAAAFEAAASQLSPALDAWLQARPQLLGAAFRVLAPLLGEVQRTLRSRGAATFDDLLRLARDLLVGHPEVAARERAGIAQLLVDEFQDTDRMQCEMLEALALGGAPGGRPGLFLVGDPKQSIYGWRSADLAAYEWFVGAVEAGGGLRMTLSVNFRSTPAILDEVERAVAPSMVARPAVQPPFEPLAPSPERADKPGFSDQDRAAVEYWVSWLPDDGPKTRSADAAALEARAIAADIRELHDTANVKWSGFGLLLRAGSDIDDYLQALRSVGVPYTVERDRSYYRRREVIEAAALVRTVLDPTDHLAMVTWLRSPSVGVPDAALMPLWSQGLPGLVTELAGPEQDRLAELRAVVQRAAALVPNDVPGVERVSGWPTALLAAIDDLATLRAAFRSESGAAFVERLRTTTLIEATEAARVLGRFRLANLDRFFRLLSPRWRLALATRRRCCVPCVVRLPRGRRPRRDGPATRSRTRCG